MREWLLATAALHAASALLARRKMERLAHGAPRIEAPPESERHGGGSFPWGPAGQDPAGPPRPRAAARDSATTARPLGGRGRGGCA